MPPGTRHSVPRNQPAVFARARSEEMDPFGGQGSRARHVNQPEMHPNLVFCEPREGAGPVEPTRVTRYSFMYNT